MQVFNHDGDLIGQPKNGQQLSGATITEGQQALLDDGDFIGFYASRYFDSNDPSARTALIGWGHGDLVGARLFERAAAHIAWNELDFYITKNNLNVTMEEIGLSLAKAHAQAVRDDRVNVHHLLSPKQVATYHHEVFDGYRIPRSLFGGTIWGLPARTYSRVWCRGCDTEP